MTTILHKLEQNPEDHELLRSLFRSTYLDGECYAFAIALHRGLNWPIVGLMKGDVVWHAGVRSPDDRVHDIRGFLTEDEFGGHFLSPPFTFHNVSESDLLAIRPVHDYTIKHARRLAEVLWPDLPWIESTASKITAFTDELEALCRKHGLWIRGAVPANPPRLFIGGGDEGGYEVRPTIDGIAYTIDQYLA